jgi:prevent-host-death family protein
MAVDNAATCGHIELVKRKTFHYPPAKPDQTVLREAAALDEPELVVNVRAAKDQLSSLLEAAARGDEVVITSDGRPKAKLVAIQPRRPRFQMHWPWLHAQPVSVGPPAEELVREDRDARP